MTYPGGEIVRCTYYKNGWIENVITEHLDEPVKVYNFEVEDWHTYYVTEQGVLVHNEYGAGANGNNFDYEDLYDLQVNNKKPIKGKEFRGGSKKIVTGGME